MAYTPSLTRLIRELSRLPGIGEKTATRLALFVLRADGEYAHALADAIVAVKQETRLCSRCFSLTEADPCGVWNAMHGISWRIERSTPIARSHGVGAAHADVARSPSS